MASVKQIKNRLTSGHIAILRAAAEGKRADPRSFSFCESRTVTKWGLLEGHGLSAKGKEVLDCLRSVAEAHSLLREIAAMRESL